MGMKNDVSFLISDTMNLYEQQSSYNPNMPLRYLMYAGLLYSKYVERNSIYLYSTKLKSIPAPRCVCFYNGEDEKEDRFELKLSQAFSGKDGDIEVTVHMININYGKNRELFDNCKPLSEYSWFIDKVRKYQKEVKNDTISAKEALRIAVDMALEEMPDSFTIKSFLLQNKAEVTNMCITEYDEEKNNELLKEESKAEGKIIMIIDFLKDGLITEDVAAKKANMSVADFRKLVAQFG